MLRVPACDPEESRVKARPPHDPSGCDPLGEIHGLAPAPLPLIPAGKIRTLLHTNPTRQRGSLGIPLARASGSTRQTPTIVTPSPRAIVSAQVLLELARWCQQRLATIEENHLCHHVDQAQESPPAQAEHADRPRDSGLARLDATTANRPAEPVDHPAAPTRRP